MRCNFLLTMEYAGQMATGGPIHMGIFREIQVPYLPSRLAPFYLSTEVEVDPPEADQTYVFELRLMDQDGDLYYQNHIEMQFHRRPDYSASYCYFNGVIVVERPIERAGSYRIDLSFGDQVMGSTRFEIRL